MSEMTTTCKPEKGLNMITMTVGISLFVSLGSSITV